MSSHRTGSITSVWFRMARIVQRVYQNMAHVFRAHGITAPQFDVLATLTRHGDLSQQALAEQMLVTKGNVSFVVTRMELAGLIDRTPDPTDSRANMLTLTPKGRALYARIMPDHDAVLRTHFGPLSVAQLEELRAHLRALDVPR